jgi:hypothetical protein
MVTLGVVVLDELANGFAQMALAQWDDVPQAFLLNRPNESFSVCVGAHRQVHPMRPKRRNVSG